MPNLKPLTDEVLHMDPEIRMRIRHLLALYLALCILPGWPIVTGLELD